MSDSAVAITNSETGNVVAQPATESTALISMIERAASDPNVDINKMERLFEMHERVESRRAEQAYNTAMATAQAEMPKVARNQDNKQTNSKYADMFAIADAALPVAHNNGFGLSFSESASNKDDCIGIDCEVSHAAGFSKRYHFDVPVDDRGINGSVNKTLTHAYGSTMTYGRRYATCGVFNIIIEGLDRDGNQPADMITEEQCNQLMALLVGGDDEPNLVSEFCRSQKIERLGELLARHFTPALTSIQNRRNREATS